jgi:DNA-binding transcriptional MerR regulator
VFRIGDFARLAQVSPKALRLYDRLGLLKPASVDSFTGYRYYNLDQLPRLNRLVALKDLGFSLEQIGRMLNHDLPAAELRGMLRLKQGELEQHARETLARLARLEARLKQIEMEEMMPHYDVTLKKIQPHTDDPNCPVCRDLKQLGGPLRTDEDVIRRMAELDAAPGDKADRVWIRKVDGANPPPGMPPPDPGSPGMFFMRSGPLPAEPGPNAEMVTMPFVEAHTLPGVESAATTVHSGEHETVVLGVRALVEWIKANGYRVAGHYQEHKVEDGYELVLPVLKVE